MSSNEVEPFYSVEELLTKVEILSVETDPKFAPVPHDDLQELAGTVGQASAR